MWNYLKTKKKENLCNSKWQAYLNRHGIPFMLFLFLLLEYCPSGNRRNGHEETKKRRRYFFPRYSCYLYPILACWWRLSCHYELDWKFNTRHLLLLSLEWYKKQKIRLYHNKKKIPYFVIYRSSINQPCNNRKWQWDIIYI